MTNEKQTDFELVGWLNQAKRNFEITLLDGTRVGWIDRKQLERFLRGEIPGAPIQNIKKEV